MAGSCDRRRTKSWGVRSRRSAWLFTIRPLGGWPPRRGERRGGGLRLMFRVRHARWLHQDRDFCNVATQIHQDDEAPWKTVPTLENADGKSQFKLRVTNSRTGLLLSQRKGAIV